MNMDKNTKFNQQLHVRIFAFETDFNTSLYFLTNNFPL